MLSLLMLFMLALTGSMEVKAQPSEWRGMTYNDDVRYSQWIINSRINDFRANSTSVGMGVFDANGEETTKPKGCKDNLDYVPGLVAKAIVENVKLNAAYSWAAPWYYSMKWFGNTYYNKFSSNATLGKSQDDLNGAKMFFALEDLTASGKFADATTNGHCITAMGTALGGLANLNSNYFIGNSSESAVSEKDAKDMGMYGGWFHKSTYVDEMWCDGLYMGPALLAQLINEYGNYSKINGNSGENDWDLITRLFTISWNQLYNSSNGLMYHAFAAASHPEYSATWTGYDPANGVYHSAAHWGRACGWYFLALVDILEQIQNAGLSSTANYEILKGYLNNLAAGLANYQDAETGCWYQVLDEKDSHLEGNYLESSCTAIFAAAYLKGTRLGYFTSNYSTVAKKAYKGCVNQFMMFDENNTAQLIHCCASAGLGKNNGKTRDGSRSYYITGSDVTQRNTYTEGKVLGGFILAATEYERAYQASKAILFSTDLKASYDLEANESITIEACGADDAEISYEWYKVGEANAVATGATFTPTASGSYYCKATSGTTTIQSSTTNVTVPGVDTETPVFTTDLAATATATVGTAKTLTVAASHADGYQWYSNTTASNTGGTEIENATSASYTFTPSAAGTLYYYCVATNSKATSTQSVASNVCTVTVSEAPAGPTVLYSTDFSSSEWSGITSVCSGKNAANETYNGITFHSYNGSDNGKPFTISQSDGTMTWCDNNMGNNYWIAIPVTGVNGSLTITVDDGNSNTNFNYVVKQETSVSGSPGSGSNATEGTPATVTVSNLDGSNCVVYLGRKGSGLKTLTSITITTPASSTPTPTTYTVSYNMNGHGDAIASVEGVTALPSTLPTPTATGWKFGGWYTDSGLTTAATAGASISDNTTLYAKWTEKAAATVSINPASGNVTVGSTLDISNYVTAGSSTGAISYSTGDASKATVTNAGVITGVAEGSANIYVTQQEDDDYKTGSVTFTVTVNATPTPATTYTVKFYNGDTQFGETQEIEEGSTVSAPTSNPTKEGYTFKGWALSNGSTLRVLFPYLVYNNVNFYAVWSNTTSGGGGEDEEIFKATATATLSVAKTTTGQEITSDNAEISGGKMYAYSGQDNEKNLIGTDNTFSGGDIGFCFTNNNTFFKIELDEPLQAGDKITAKSYTRTDVGVGIWMSTETSRPDASTTKIVTDVASTTSWVTLPEYTVIDNDGICGESTIYLYRAEGKTIYFTDFTITREGQAVGNDITLDATTDYENFDSYVGTNKNVTLRRNFTEGEWTTLVLPFSVTTEQLVAAFDNDDECELAKIKSMSVAQGKGSIHYTTVSSIEANKPVLAKIKPNDDGKYVFNGVTVVAPTSVVSTSTDGKVEMHGVYKTTGYTDISEDAYFLSGGKFYDWSYLNAMSPFSAYILPVGENAQYVQSISFDDEATGVVNVNGNGNANENESYNLAGQRVTKEYNGIVIIKGKKVFTK
ncbi:MAG: glycoside hydrolase family 88 protein [Prevotella sp.]|nr:glycoside hydrolase family 88 protein [Prevotella sp.]